MLFTNIDPGEYCKDQYSCPVGDLCYTARTRHNEVLNARAFRSIEQTIEAEASYQNTLEQIKNLRRKCKDKIYTCPHSSIIEDADPRVYLD